MTKWIKISTEGESHPFLSHLKYGPLTVVVATEKVAVNEWGGWDWKITPRIITGSHIPEGFHKCIKVNKTGGPSRLDESKWDCLMLALGYCLRKGWHEVEVEEN